MLTVNPRNFSSIIVILTLINAMKIGESRTIFNELTPISSTNTCLENGDFGCICNNNQDCSRTKYLECTDGKCACEFPKRRTFDAALGKCVSLVGSFCDKEERMHPECVRNSECNGRCVCREGYGKTENNTCQLNFGENCGIQQCNVDRGLACKEGSCRCIDSSFVYSAISSNCIDPEAVVRNFIQSFTERLVRGIFMFKLNQLRATILLPFRLVTRIALG